MECVQGRDHAEFLGPVVIVRVAAGELEGGFVGFRARVAQKHALGEGRVDELRGKPQRGLVGHPVRYVPERMRLLREHLDDRGVAVPERGHGHAAGEVDVHPPLLVPHPRPGGTHGDERRGRIARHHQLIEHRPRDRQQWRVRFDAGAGAGGEEGSGRRGHGGNCS